MKGSSTSRPTAWNPGIQLIRWRRKARLFPSSTYHNFTSTSMGTKKLSKQAPTVKSGSSLAALLSVNVPIDEELDDIFAHSVSSNIWQPKIVVVEIYQL